MITGEILILEWLWGAEERISYLDSEDPGWNPEVPPISSVILDKSKVILSFAKCIKQLSKCFQACWVQIRWWSRGALPNGGVKEMLLVTVILTTLIFQFLLKFYSLIIVHFIFGTFCTWQMWSPKSKKALIYLAWITRWFIWLPYCNWAFLTSFFFSIANLWLHFHFRWRKCPQILTPYLSKFIFHFSHEARLEGNGARSLCSGNNKLPLQRGHFPILAQRAQNCFIYYKRKSNE